MSSHSENYVWLDDLKKLNLPEDNTYFTASFGLVDIVFYNDRLMGLRNFFLCLTQNNPEIKVDIKKAEIKEKKDAECK